MKRPLDVANLLFVVPFVTAALSVLVTVVVGTSTTA